LPAGRSGGHHGRPRRALHRRQSGRRPHVPGSGADHRGSIRPPALHHAAQREADFLLLESTGLWDTTFGGGFWWNTGRGDSVEGKPAQTNALAALFFARLSAATNDAPYREW